MLHKKINLRASLSFLLALTVFSTWVSQSLLDFTFSIVLICWLLNLWFNNSWRDIISNTSLNRAFFLMFGYFLIACLGYYFNGRPEADLLFNLSRFSWILMLYILVWAIQKLDFKSKFFNYFYYLLCLPALYSFNVFFKKTEGFSSPLDVDIRIVGLVNSATYHGHIGGLLFLLGFSFLFLKWSSERIKEKTNFEYLKENLFLILATFCVLISVIFSKTRGALLSVFISLFVLFLIRYRLNFIKLCILMTLVLLPLLWFFPLGGKLVRQGSDTCRMQLALVHIEMIKAKPFLGIGYRDNMRNISDYWPDSLRNAECETFRLEGGQAHNQFLNVAGTTGLLGLFFYLSFVLYFLWINWGLMHKTKSNLSVLCFVIQVFFLMSCMTEITFEFAKIRYLILCVWALVAVLVEKERVSSKISN